MVCARYRGRMDAAMTLPHALIGAVGGAAFAALIACGIMAVIWFIHR
jgi:hypothetical protein